MILKRFLAVLVSVFLQSACIASAASIPAKKDQTQLVNTHNNYRLKIGLVRIQWSGKLAENALLWAKNLEDRNCPLEHSTEAFSNGYGENLYAVWGYGSRINLGAAVRMWGAESQFYSYSNNSCTEGKVCGHYTQMIWGTTKQIGCAKARCQSGEKTTDILVCQYDPAGNYVGERPY